MITSDIEVELHTKNVVNNVLQINGAKASTGEKAIFAECLLCHLNQNMQSITEPSGQKTRFWFKLNIAMNIQEIYVGKDLLQIPGQIGEEAPNFFSKCWDSAMKKQKNLQPCGHRPT
jgi:hypothetical protein